MQWLSFCDRLMSLGIMASKLLLHTVTNDEVSLFPFFFFFFFKAERYSIVCLSHHYVSIYLSMDIRVVSVSWLL